MCWLRQHASWRRLALRARRRWRGRCAPGACGEPDLRLALRARRSALRAKGAARLCAGRRSRWLLSPSRATRSAPMTWALRAWAPAAARSPPRATRSAPKALALRAQARTGVPPPDILSALPLGGGDVEDVVRFALLETLVARRASRSCQGRGWGGVVRTSSRASVRGNACVLPQHVQCESARSAAGIGAPSPQARPIPRSFSARAPALRAGAVRTRRRCAPAPFSCDSQ